MIDHFRETLEANGVDVAAAESEWTGLKHALYTNGYVIKLINI